MTKGTLTGTWAPDPLTGKPPRGWVLIRPTEREIRDTVTNELLGLGWEGPLDPAGSFSVQLQHTDQPEVTNPAGFGYTIEVRVNNERVGPITFAFPAAVAALDYSDLMPSETDPEFAPVLRGLSAYQVAVANGFVGTEAEWLASLQGGGSSGELSAHVAAPRPHVAAESGRDFAGWFGAGLTP